MFFYDYLNHYQAQEFIDSIDGAWLTVNSIVKLYAISKHRLVFSIESGLVPALRIGSHYYVSEDAIKAGVGLGFSPAKREPRSTVHKDQTNFLNLVDVANEIEVAS